MSHQECKQCKIIPEQVVPMSKYSENVVTNSISSLSQCLHLLNGQQNWRLNIRIHSCCTCVLCPISYRLKCFFLNKFSGCFEAEIFLCFSVLSGLRLSYAECQYFVLHQSNIEWSIKKNKLYQILRSHFLFPKVWEVLPLTRPVSK